jgi:hypothetical protein
MISYSTRYERLVLLLLTAAYAFNAMDRGIISIIGQAMKMDLGLSDTQFGLLSGTAFAALYAFGGIPIARLAERFNRVNIIAVAMVVWSSLTVVCGLAAHFTQLLLSRAGVGIAEAGCTPPAHSLISDYFEPGRRTSALSVYSSGISAGYLVAALPIRLDVERTWPLPRLLVFADLRLRTQRCGDAVAESPFPVLTVGGANITVDHETPIVIADIGRGAMHGEQIPEQQITRFHFAHDRL